jgi:hypothetical protein
MRSGSAVASSASSATGVARPVRRDWTPDAAPFRPRAFGPGRARVRADVETAKPQRRRWAMAARSLLDLVPGTCRARKSGRRGPTRYLIPLRAVGCGRSTVRRRREEVKSTPASDGVVLPAVALDTPRPAGGCRTSHQRGVQRRGTSSARPHRGMPRCGGRQEGQRPHAVSHATSTSGLRAGNGRRSESQQGRRRRPGNRLGRRSIPGAPLRRGVCRGGVLPSTLHPASRSLRATGTGRNIASSFGASTASSAGKLLAGGVEGSSVVMDGTETAPCSGGEIRQATAPPPPP